MTENPTNQPAPSEPVTDDGAGAMRDEATGRHSSVEAEAASGAVGGASAHDDSSRTGRASDGDASGGDDFPLGGRQSTSRLPMGVSFDSLVEEFSILRLFFGLFLYPRLALLNARFYRLWFKTLVILALLVVGHSCIKVNGEGDELERQAASLMKLCGSSLTSLTCSVGGESAEGYAFDWGNPTVKAPFHAENADWRLDVLERVGDFDQSVAGVCEATKGLIIGRDGIGAWLEDEEQACVVCRFPSRNLCDVFRQFGKPHENAYELDSKALMSLCDTFRLGVLWMTGALYAMESLQMILTCLVIFVIITYLFNRHEHKTFGAVVASAEACIIPPFFLATVSDLLIQSTMGLNSLFTLFFVIYLLVIYFDRSVVAVASEQ